MDIVRSEILALGKKTLQIFAMNFPMSVQLFQSQTKSLSFRHSFRLSTSSCLHLISILLFRFPYVFWMYSSMMHEISWKFILDVFLVFRVLSIDSNWWRISRGEKAQHRLQVESQVEHSGASRWEVGLNHQYFFHIFPCLMLKSFIILNPSSSLWAWILRAWIFSSAGGSQQWGTP